MLPYANLSGPLETPSNPLSRGALSDQRQFLTSSVLTTLHICVPSPSQALFHLIIVTIQGRCANYFTTRKLKLSNLAKMYCMLAELGFKLRAM